MEESKGFLDFKELMKSEMTRHLLSEFLDGVTDDPKEKELILGITAEVANGKTLGQGFGLTNEHLDLVTGLAAQQYLVGRYEEAIKLYAFVVAMNNLHAGALKGLAMSHKKLGVTEEALRYFALTLLVEPEDMESVLMAAECLANIGKDSEALEIVQKIIERPQGRGTAMSMSMLKEKALGLKEIISQKMKSS